ncbi:unnamed protein product [Arabis nemorensis]|uniref:RNA polymerase II subunit B1 CTD phosphatase RPAP2 homolog n=1 Tax=Arabis nemorensis TaxID=586526 RepID=A0A565CNJ4_9BRAS|nr:unnamed protein product [Arabis nemorensis]
MSKDQVIAVNDAVHKLQLAMLDGITDQKQLIAARKLMSRLDYEDVVTERTIAKLCGYPLCRTSLPSEVSRRGKYRISLKEHRVYDLQETRKFCSADCLISSRAFSGSLQEARTSDFDTVKLNEILGLFTDSDVKDAFDVSEDLGLSKLTIRENFEVRGGELSLEQWMGPSNAVEGYVPIDKSNCKSTNGKLDSMVTQSNQEKKKEENPPFSEMDFTSTVIVSDEYSVSKVRPQTTQASPARESEDGKGKSIPREQTPLPPKKISRFRREKERDRKNSGFDGASSVTMNDGQLKGNLKTLDEESSLAGSSSASSGFGKDREMEDIKNFGFDEMGSEISAIMSDGYSIEYSVSKQPPCSMEDPLSCHLKGGLETLDKRNALIGFSSGSKTKDSSKRTEKLGKKVICIEYHANSSEDADEILTADSCKGPKAQDVCSSCETVAKSCLKNSGPKKLRRSVTWADQKDGCSDLCEFRNNDWEAGHKLSFTDTKDVDSVSRLALAEACATALSQAVKAVSSGESDASDAAAKVGIVLLPSTHQLGEEVSEMDTEEEMSEEDEPTLLKWPNRPGIPDTDLFDRDQSWFDGPPEGFSLSLSSFGMMWDSLFGWVSASSLAYIYGKDASAYEEFLSVNGIQYLRKVILGDGLSSEIKETIAGCLARALPRVATDLRLPIAISELEKGLGSLLETMSLTGAVPSFKMEQWLVIILVFLDALSVSRIPRIAPYICNRNKILEGSGIGNEEYEIMKDILLPLGRVPQFASRSGA